MLCKKCIYIFFCILMHQVKGRCALYFEFSRFPPDFLCMDSLLCLTGLYTLQIIAVTPLTSCTHYKTKQKTKTQLHMSLCIMGLYVDLYVCRCICMCIIVDRFVCLSVCFVFVCTCVYLGRCFCMCGVLT